MNSSNIKPSTRYWLVVILSFLWYAVGVFNYLAQAYMTDETLVSFPDEVQLYYTNLPAWVTAAFALAVFGGLLGSVGLFLRKKWASFLFLGSFFAIVAQQFHSFFVQDFIEITIEKAIMPLLVLIIALYMIYYSRKSETEGLLI
ncbi:hypothetical protein N9C87_01280 [Flavobacteriaceae bacterium]|jgi:hypothetical protein|nr:hypothetical protein [Flavobacteriaceae bacterium]MDC0949800.1 hypothetical protein [Flavobacteriaceae bacterium]